MGHGIPRSRSTGTTEPVVVVPAPAAIPDREAMSGAWTTTLPMLGGVGSMLMVAGSTGAGGRGYVVGGLFLLSTVAMALTQVVRQHRQQTRRLAELRTRHRAQLGDARAQALAAAADQRTRAAQESGMAAVRVGLAAVRLPVRFELSEEAPAAPVDPVTADAVDSFLATWSITPCVPVTVDLVADSVLDVRGPTATCTSAARALLLRVTRSHHPRELLVAVVARRDRVAAWEWTKWLPHAWSPVAADDVGPSRLVVSDPAALSLLLGDDPPHVLAVFDGVRPPTRQPGVGRRSTVVVGGNTGGHHLDLPDAPNTPARLVRPGRAPVEVAADLLGPAEAEAAAREVARHLAPDGDGTERDTIGKAPVDVVDLLGLGAVGPAATRPSRPVEKRLDVVIGTAPDGAAVRLNLRESAYGGSGPHGLVVGATGSGKSELVRTLVLALAATHRPDELALVLVDFKGGATFAGLGGLPHVSALVTNLADDHTLVARMQDALAGELERRQEVLHASGHANLREYDAARRAGAQLEPLPSLFVCVDEFSELLTARPEFIDLFVAIGRLGRSLGIHLLLATQRLEEGRLRGLESHLSYRIGLRTFSAAESRVAIGVPDAHSLPTRPGVGLLKQGAEDLVRFDAAYVSGPLTGHDPTSDPTADQDGGEAPVPVLPYSAAPVLVHPPDCAPRPAADLAPPTGRTTLLEHVVALLDDGSRVRRIWLPPFDRPTTLGDHLGEDELVLGEVDLPREQRREPLTVDLTGATGHFAVIGGPRSGRSTVLQSLVASLALRHTPQEVQFLLLDLGGGSLAPLDRLPHVLALARRGDELVGRAVQAAVDLVNRRESAFREVGATSATEYRTRTGEALADVHVVVDGWGTLRTEYEDQEVALARLAARGLTFGVHLVLASTRWSDLRPTLRDLVGSRIELRLGDPLDSEVDRRAAARVPVGRPGRGLDARGRDVLCALPRIDGSTEPTTAADGLRQLVEHVVDGWRGPVPQRLRVLPEQIAVDTLDPATSGVALGLTENGSTLGVLHDESHLLVLGDDRSGRTETLRTLLHQLTRTLTPDRAQVVVVDPRGGLRGVVGDEHLVAHLGTRSRIVSGLSDLAHHLRERLPGPDVTSEQLLERSWWIGPDVYVVVDDHDLVTAGSWQESPTRPLAELLPQASEVGLHLVLARRSDTTRAHDPVLTALTELGSPTLLLPGHPSSGAVVGRLRPQPGPAGRGRYVTRGSGVRTVQVAVCPASLSDGPTGTSRAPLPGQRSA